MVVSIMDKGAGSVAEVLNTRHATAKANGWKETAPSKSVFVAAALCFTVVALLPGAPSPAGPLQWMAIPLMAAVCTLVEAVSPHGWDNTLLQLVPAALVTVLFKGGLT